MNIDNVFLFVSQRENYLPSLRFYFSSVSSSHIPPIISRWINKFCYNLALGSSINRYDNSFTVYSSFADKKLYSKYEKDGIFCNFGSGAFFHKRWRNYDFPGQSSYYKTIQGRAYRDYFPIDLCNKSLKFQEADNSVSLIYCSHTLEHLEVDAGYRFLSECFRVLTPGGILRVALPNTRNDFYTLSCLFSDNRDENNLRNLFLRQAATHIITDTKSLHFDELKGLIVSNEFRAYDFFKIINEKFPQFTTFNEKNPERHISYWDQEVLITSTEQIGFRYCIPMLQGASLARPFTNINVFDNTEPHTAIYADIVK